MTVEEKRDELKHKFCAFCSDCAACGLFEPCRRVSPFQSPVTMDDEAIEKLYQEYMKIKGEPIMNEHETQTTLEATIDGTIVIPREEYAYLIAKSAKADLLEDYVNNRDYLDKDVVRAILGMYRSEESEGE